MPFIMALHSRKVNFAGMPAKVLAFTLTGASFSPSAALIWTLPPEFSAAAASLPVVGIKALVGHVDPLEEANSVR